MKLSNLELEELFKIAKFKNPNFGKNQNPRNFFVFWTTESIHACLQSFAGRHLAGLTLTWWKIVKISYDYVKKANFIFFFRSVHQVL